MNTVMIMLVEVVESGHEHDLGHFESPFVPRSGEFVEWEGIIFRVEHVIWTPTQAEGFIAAMVTVRFHTTSGELEGESPEAHAKRTGG